MVLSDSDRSGMAHVSLIMGSRYDTDIAAFNLPTITRKAAACRTASHGCVGSNRESCTLGRIVVPLMLTHSVHHGRRPRLHWWCWWHLECPGTRLDPGMLFREWSHRDVGHERRSLPRRADMRLCSFNRCRCVGAIIKTAAVLHGANQLQLATHTTTHLEQLNWSRRRTHSNSPPGLSKYHHPPSDATSITATSPHACPSPLESSAAA